jgi:hypothetical protein
MWAVFLLCLWMGAWLMQWYRTLAYPSRMDYHSFCGRYQCLFAPDLGKRWVHSHLPPPPPRHTYTHTGTRTPLSVSLSCHIYAMAPTPHQAHLCTHTHTHTHTSTHTLLLSHMRTPSYSFLLCFPTMNEHTCAHPNSLCLYISLSSCFSLSLSFTLVPCILMIVMVGRGSGRTRGRPQRRCSRTLPRGIPRQPSSWGAPKCLPATTCTGARPWHPHTRIRTHIRACRAPFSCFGSRHTHRHTHTNVD